MWKESGQVTAFVIRWRSDGRVIWVTKIQPIANHLEAQREIDRLTCIYLVGLHGLRQSSIKD